MALLSVIAHWIASINNNEATWFVMLAVTFLMWALWNHREHAVFTPHIPKSVPILPGAKPILGHATIVLNNLPRMHEWLMESTRRMGYKTYAFTIPTLPTYYMVTDPACLEYILKHNNDSFIKGHMFVKNMGCLLGHGIFTSDGEQWSWQRKLAINIFSVKSFKQYINEVFAAKLDLLVNKLSHSADSKAPVDLHELMYQFTLDTFGQIGFGVNPGCLASTTKVPFAAAFDRAQVVVNKRFWVPGWPLLEFLTGEQFELAADVRVIKQFATDIIRRRREQLAAAAATNVSSKADCDDDCNDGDAPPRDLLSLFMEAQGPNGKPLDEKQLVDTVLNFIIAGRDTTAQALSWTFYQLMHHPECEVKLLSELQEVLGEAHSHLIHPTYDQIRQLKFTKACFLEALRLSPSVPENVRYATKDHVLPDKSVIPKNGQMVYSPYVVNRLPAFWGHDAEEFRPERWLEMDTVPTPYQYLSFNAGPRLCLGQRLAELEGVYVLAGLLSRFKFEQVMPGKKVTYQLASTMPMKDGLQVYVQPRE